MLVRVVETLSDVVTKFNLTSVVGDGAVRDDHLLDGWGWEGSRG